MPEQREDPKALRWLIGSELLNARNKAGATQAQASKAAGCSHVTVSNMESGSTAQEPARITKLMKFYKCDQSDIDRLARLAGSYAGKGAWWADFKDVVEDWFATFVGLEGLANAEFVWEPMVIPGMLQIPAYHEALLDNHLRFSPAEVPNVVSLRRARQERLRSSENPLDFTTFIEPRTLDRLVGGPQVMRQQLEALREWNKLPNVHLYVPSEEIAVHDGLDGEFTLLDFAVAQSIGYIEFQDGARYIQDQDRVRTYDLARKRMCKAVAQDHDEARRLAEEAIASRLDRLAAA
ncbi:Scr1 family TA system antitoxin-like transcriptional regulator [Actinokineospora enzanensis]|uniref:Scr1 family TA system antitoxin-like transcriptional regulator n=1 Tax=Actinokineospora enzanensis TaxID=155975 RepID=UPI0003A66D30|nr:Scr1 family TA system antitoxin-like transcriptional regulator [Actinokineospora enzanensis]